MVLRLQCVSEWPRGLAGSHPQISYSVGAAWGTGIHNSISFPGKVTLLVRETHLENQLPSLTNSHLENILFKGLPCSLKELWQQASLPDKVQSTQLGKILEGGPSERHWVRSWSVAAALMKCPIISGCLSPQTSLSTKGSQPSCLLPASWSRAAAGPTSLCTGDPSVGVVRTWAGPPPGDFLPTSSRPLTSALLTGETSLHCLEVKCWRFIVIATDPLSARGVEEP